MGIPCRVWVTLDNEGMGGIRLTVDATYCLSTNFNFYGAFWSDWVMHDFQVYVLNTVKQRVER